jgi:N-acetylmuramoyl-L-alanine amidase
VLLLLAPAAEARRHRPEGWARQQFASAEKMREALNGRPAEDRSRREYQRVIDAYRRVYLGLPTSAKADPSVVATGELLVELGRQFDDAKILRSAIEQYEFLRREYPGSRYRFDALFTIGQIYKDDLDDTGRARETFEEFLRRYPRHQLAEQARQELSAPVQAAASRKPLTRSNSKPGNKTDTRNIQPPTANDDDSATEDSDESAGNSAAPGSSGGRPRVTGIRHWSTPGYTRVAIDLEQKVGFASQRISDPDRIFFDLRGTRLSSTLVGKTFEVDDGFLKKIRVAQFSSDRTRVVLEVESLSAYEAFLLPNPYRLIIDIHGKDIPGKNRRGKKMPGPDMPAKGAGNAASGAAAQEQSGDDTAPLESASKKAPAALATEKIKVTNAPVKAAAAKSPPPSDPDTEAVDTDDEKPAITKASGAKKPAQKAADDEPVQSAKELPPARISDLPESRGSRAGKSRRKADNKAAEVHEARPTADGDRSLIRALGLKIGKIVIDPGHGGHDTGTIGPNGVREKDVVLDVGRRLGKLLQQRLGAEVIYTRQDDTFIPLETRTAIANREQADLFVSVHANSSDDPDARGVETYYLNFTSSKDALEVAARENAVSDKSVHELQDLVKKIALKEKIEESREFAGDVQSALHSGLAVKNPGMRNRGVRKAPFIVLIGANMPSILAEISFVSNPTDARKLQTPDHRQRIAESLYRGIAHYASGLSGVRVASRITRSDGQ